VALGLPGTCTTFWRSHTRIVPPHNGHSFVPGMILVAVGDRFADVITRALP
jgi:hypothetical protein